MKALLIILAIIHLLPLIVFAWTEVLGLNLFTSRQLMISVFMFMSGMFVLTSIDITETYKSLERKCSNDTK